MHFGFSSTTTIQFLSSQIMSQTQCYVSGPMYISPFLWNALIKMLVVASVILTDMWGACVRTMTTSVGAASQVVSQNREDNWGKLNVEATVCIYHGMKTKSPWLWVVNSDYVWWCSVAQKPAAPVIWFAPQSDGDFITLPYMWPNLHDIKFTLCEGIRETISTLASFASN